VSIRYIRQVTKGKEQEKKGAEHNSKRNQCLIVCDRDAQVSGIDITGGKKKRGGYRCIGRNQRAQGEYMSIVEAGAGTYNGTANLTNNPDVIGPADGRDTKRCIATRWQQKESRGGGVDLEIPQVS